MKIERKSNEKGKKVNFLPFFLVVSEKSHNFAFWQQKLNQ